ncbi:TPA: tRNA lysidine(34) synthetase TilS [Candidatus Dependentiae bacterium]|nr:MAG: tRNA(Ile)-lysidine synthase [candidate division TM6 bacterium GW2011_GWE2_31_21]KKP53027.1 MAG: tRNA(Ile)-lysidine synthase [candidate division TM6 bacterium GW2011_GWF2_33_332]HBS48093.1 tRNA lysidine(34) synthetase TilS [Candidatus Dependentiae bacterium]HBZ73512.1 tRNA lysidine(34) synthetase TilS [Candidatus Dependentiae bacterium]
MILEKIKTKVLSLTKSTSKPKIILGLSGGADSTFLFHALKNLHHENKITLIAAHLNHGWRQEAIIDENFCRDLCNQFQIQLEIVNASSFDPIKSNGSKEELGRNLRRQFFDESVQKHNADFVALAHHLQDQQETFLWRILRGTTLSGLTCMKEIDGFYIRPLLDISKDEILNYLKENNLTYIEDESNYSEKFLRNRIRKNIIPALRECDSRFDIKFQDTLTALIKENEFLDQLTNDIFINMFQQNDKLLIGNLKTFLATHEVLQNRLIIKWLCSEKVKFQISSNFISEIIKFLKSKEGGSHTLHQNWKINKKGTSFWISK